MRVLIVLLAVQLSGVGHALADLALLGDESAIDAHGDCSSEEPGRDCPPGCPTCHHANGGVGSLPREHLFTALLAASPEAAQFAPLEADTPPNPDLPSVFRPPKFA